MKVRPFFIEGHPVSMIDPKMDLFILSNAPQPPLNPESVRERGGEGELWKLLSFLCAY
jgi:hypothetical protein